MSNIEKSIDVNVPVHTAYNQWTQFEEFPRFMEGVEQVRQLNDKQLHWCANVGGKVKEWDAEITEQIPDQRIAWKNTTGATNAGVVTFHRLGDGKTRVMLQIEYNPEGIIENIGDAVGVVSARVRGDLERFKEFIESRGTETGAWRGKIEQPNKGRGESAMKETAEKTMKPKDTPEASQNSQTQHGMDPTDPQASQATKSGEEQGQQSAPAIKTNGEQSAQPNQSVRAGGEQRRQQQLGLARRDWLTSSQWMENPFARMQRFSEEMHRIFEDFGVGRSLFGSRSGRGREMEPRMWAPQIEVYERDNQLLVCADLPGLKKDDIKVEFNENMLTIQGERRHEFEETQEGYKRSERSYGSFYRSIPLPEDVDSENAKATFQDGVLKVTMPLPQRHQQRSRRIEIHGTDERQSRSQTKGSEESSSRPHA